MIDISGLFTSSLLIVNYVRLLPQRLEWRSASLTATLTSLHINGSLPGLQSEIIPGQRTRPTVLSVVSNFHILTSVRKKTFPVVKVFAVPFTFLFYLIYFTQFSLSHMVHVTLL